MTVAQAGMGYGQGRPGDVDDNRWVAAKEIIGTERVTLGPQASDQWLHAPDHLAMVLARYRAAAALICGATWHGWPVHKDARRSRMGWRQALASSRRMPRS